MKRAAKPHEADDDHDCGTCGGSGGGDGPWKCLECGGSGISPSFTRARREAREEAMAEAAEDDDPWRS